MASRLQTYYRALDRWLGLFYRFKAGLEKGALMSALGQKRTNAVQKAMSAIRGFARSAVAREFAAVGLRTTNHSRN